MAHHEMQAVPIHDKCQDQNTLIRHA